MHGFEGVGYFLRVVAGNGNTATYLRDNFDLLHRGELDGHHRLVHEGGWNLEPDARGELVALPGGGCKALGLNDFPNLKR